MLGVLIDIRGHQMLLMEWSDTRQFLVWLGQDHKYLLGSTQLVVKDPKMSPKFEVGRIQLFH